MKTTPRLSLLFALLGLAGCGPDSAANVAGGDEESFSGDELTTTVSDDDLNGLWTATVAGAALADDAVVESWPAVGVRLHLGGAVYQLSRTADTLSGTGATLAVNANGSVAKNTLEGSVNGAAVLLKRDTAAKPSLTVTFPKDRPFRSFLTDTLVPLAQRDRESYTVVHSSSMGAWLRSCELYKHGSWLRSFKGDTWSAQAASFGNVVYAVNNIKTTPRRMTKEYKLSSALKANLKNPDQDIALMLSTFAMYFSTGAGRSLHLPLTASSTAYFITDRPVRAERIGLVVMDTPTHGPLASTFGRQLLDLGAMSAADDAVYVRALMELLAKSDNTRAAQLSGTGQSALTDWYSVMAIEDYRGVTFGWPTLGWGYNMSSAQFYGLVVRALARPGQVDAAGNPVAGQVIVGSELRPGDPSYADVLNGGGDMQEYGDMARLKQLATAYLQARHPEQIAAVRNAFAGIVPASQLDYRAQSDVFHFVCQQLYDAQGRTANLKGAQADQAVAAVAALLDTLNQESAQFEAFVLTQGVTKSNVAAPKSTGF